MPKTTKLSTENTLGSTPAADGFHMAAEWTEHRRTWIAWPHRKEVWKDDFNAAQNAFESLVRTISRFEPVVLITDPNDAVYVTPRFQTSKHVSVSTVNIDDSWIRDNGPTFLVGTEGQVRATLWNFNAWGEKHVPYASDAQLAKTICRINGIPAYTAPLVCEGGGIHTNGAGTLLTTDTVVLNANRNPAMSRAKVTDILQQYTGCDHTIWLPNGIVGDETDGHIDNVACFVEPNTVFATHTSDRHDENYVPLKENLEVLSDATTSSNEKLQVVRLPLPNPVMHNGRRLTASYLNFYFANGAVVVPVFDDPNDAVAVSIFKKCFKNRTIATFKARPICVGGGGIHCVVLNEPK
jgi:agmatine deiminase